MTQRISRRSLLALGGASLVAAAFRVSTGAPVDALTVTASPAADNAISYPTGTDDLVLRVESGGGFVPVEVAIAEFPLFSLYGDGQLVVLGPQIEIFPQPALTNLRSIQLTAERVQEILVFARDAGLLDGDKSYLDMTVADAPTTTFTVNANGARHVVSAYALGINETMIPDAAEREARARLLSYLDWLGQLAFSVPPGEDKPYEIERLQVVATPIDPANPPGTDQGLEQPEIAWPLDEPLSGFGATGAIVSPLPDGRCGEIAGEDAQTLVAALQDANQFTPWVSEGTPYQLIVRPLLPDEAACGLDAEATPAAG